MRISRRLTLLVLPLAVCSQARALEELKAFPGEIAGTWIYETGDKAVDGCVTSQIKITTALITIPTKCIDERPSFLKYRVKKVLVDRAFFSDAIKEYHILTDGPNVVLEPFREGMSASIYLQFWITNEYARTRQLGVFSWSH